MKVISGIVDEKKYWCRSRALADVPDSLGTARSGMLTRAFYQCGAHSHLQQHNSSLIISPFTHTVYLETPLTRN